MSRLVSICMTLLLALISLTLPAFAQAEPIVIFDQGHNQRFLVNGEGPLQLSRLAGQFREQGFKVATSDGPLSAAVLAGTDALVISGPFNAYTQSEIDTIAGYIEKGGRLAVMLHIGSPLTALLDRLGIVVSGSVIHERENIIKTDDINFRVTTVEPHPLTAAIERFSIYGGWALLNDKPNTAVIARTSDKAWIDLNGDRKLTEGDAVQSFAVAVTGVLGRGEYVVFGDDALFQNQYLDENNAALAANLAKWLKQ